MANCKFIYKNWKEITKDNTSYLLRQGMSSKQQTNQSKTLSWILRHGANDIGIKMDNEG